MICFQTSSGTFPPPKISLSSSMVKSPLPSLSKELKATSNLYFDNTCSRSMDAATNSNNEYKIPPE